LFKIKFEARNSKSETNTKFKIINIKQYIEFRFEFRILDFDIISDFVLRISDLVQVCVSLLKLGWDPISKTEHGGASRGREIFLQKNTRDCSQRKSAGAVLCPTTCRE
jgi:hypothetical protein